MPIILKTPEDQAHMRVAGRLAAEVLDMIGEHVQPGVTTGELDAICHQYITEHQAATPAPLNYRGFPKSICTSVNHVVCHGIPGPKMLKDGDILHFGDVECRIIEVEAEKVACCCRRSWALRLS